ncbi:hypothetical protein SESBI_24307 [Sesbania bispinosa]|nr:hypothetical protein SESBI_24307 [Sesbania bispinosa]
MQFLPTCEFNAFTWPTHVCELPSYHYQHSPTSLSSDLLPPRRFTTTTIKFLRECFFTDVNEGLNDDLVVTRRIQLKKAFQKLLKIGFCVDLSLKYHLEHRIPEIFMWILRVLLNGDAITEFCAWFGYTVGDGGVVMVLMVSFGFGDGGGSEVFLVNDAVTGSCGGCGGGKGFGLLQPQPPPCKALMSFLLLEDINGNK